MAGNITEVLSLHWLCVADFSDLFLVYPATCSWPEEGSSAPHLHTSILMGYDTLLRGHLACRNLALLILQSSWGMETV